MKKTNVSKSRSSVCVICKSKDTKELYKSNANINRLSFTYEFSPNAKKTFRVVRCKSCSHVFCDPLPKNFYKHYLDVVDKKYLTQEEDRKATARVIIKEILKEKSKGKMLDIGCATGDFLVVAKEHGFVAEGLELSRWSSGIAKSKGITTYSHSIKVHSRKFPKKYDVITLWGVIEHFEDPLAEMENINALLKPNGIVVLWTGDVDSITSKLMGRNWWYWLGQHIQYFTRDSLGLLGDKTGFGEIFSKIYPQAVSYQKVENSMSRYKNKNLLFLFRLLFSIRKIWFVKIPGEIFWMAKKTSEK